MHENNYLLPLKKTEDRWRLGNKNKQEFILYFTRLTLSFVVEKKQKIGGALEIKINKSLFCISLGLHYLCSVVASITLTK